jgi:hypothetical protein
VGGPRSCWGCGTSWASPSWWPCFVSRDPTSHGPQGPTAWWRSIRAHLPASPSPAQNGDLPFVSSLGAAWVLVPRKGSSGDLVPCRGSSGVLVPCKGSSGVLVPRKGSPGSWSAARAPARSWSLQGLCQGLSAVIRGSPRDPWRPPRIARGLCVVNKGFMGIHGGLQDLLGFYLQSIRVSQGFLGLTLVCQGSQQQNRFWINAETSCIARGHFG